MHAMRPLGPAASTTSLASVPAVSSVYQNCMQSTFTACAVSFLEHGTRAQSKAEYHDQSCSNLILMSLNTFRAGTEHTVPPWVKPASQLPVRGPNSRRRDCCCPVRQPELPRGTRSGLQARSHSGLGALSHRLCCACHLWSA